MSYIRHFEHERSEWRNLFPLDEISRRADALARNDD